MGMSNYSIKLSFKYLFKVAIALFITTTTAYIIFCVERIFLFFKVAISFFEEQILYMFTLFEK